MPVRFIAPYFDSGAIPRELFDKQRYTTLTKGCSLSSPKVGAKTYRIMRAFDSYKIDLESSFSQSKQGFGQKSRGYRIEIVGLDSDLEYD